MKNSFIIISLAFISISCETVIDFDIPREDPKLTIDTRIMAGDSVMAFIGTTEYVLSSKNPGLDQNSKAYLYEDGIRVSELKPKFRFFGTKNDSLFYYSSDYLTSEGHVYKLQAEREGFVTASGQTVLKAKVDISNVDYDSTNARVSLSFVDPAGAGDYYRVAAYYNIANISGDLYISTNDRSIQFIDGYEDDIFDADERGGYYGYLTDEYFDGRAKRITLNINSGEPLSSDSLFFEVTRITEEYYLHEKSKAASEASDGFFSEPVQVFTNIENGYGVVAGGSPNKVPLFP